MIFTDALAALVVAGFLTAIFAAGFAGRASWAVVPFFLIVFVVAWAGGSWMESEGELSWTEHLLPFAYVGFIVAIVLAFATPPRRGARVRGGGRDASPLVAVESLLWVVVFMLLLAVIVRYLM
jgi:hypothetical protein